MLSLATAAARRAYSPANLDDIFFRVTRMRLVAEILLVSIVSLFFFLGGGGVQPYQVNSSPRFLV